MKIKNGILSIAVSLVIIATAFSVAVLKDGGLDSDGGFGDGQGMQPLPAGQPEQPEILLNWNADTREVEVFKALFIFDELILDPILPVYTADLGDHKTLKHYLAENLPYFTEMDLVEKHLDGNIGVRVLGFNYNGGAQIVLGENHYYMEFKEGKTGELAHAHQNIHLENEYKMNIQYDSKDDMTKIGYNQKGETKVSAELYTIATVALVTFQSSMGVIILPRICTGDIYWPGTWPERPWPDIRKKDTDKDGLTDCHEMIIFKTDKTDADTDGDQWRDGHEVHNTKTSPLVFNDRYAVLLSGGIDRCSNFARYWNDLQFMYGVLSVYNYTDDNGLGNNPAHQAGFSAAQAAAGDHIIVLYADGNPANANNTPNATACPGSGWHPGGGGYHNETDGGVDQGQPLYDIGRGSIQNPVGNSSNPTKGPWPNLVNMPIDFSASKANLQTVFNVLSQMMTANDFLFVLTSNHGSGYYNKGGVAYYDSGRIAINSDGHSDEIVNDNMKESGLAFDGTELPSDKHYRWDFDGDSIHDDLLYNNSGTIQLLMDADDDGDGTQDPGEHWNADYVDNNNDQIIDKNDDKGNQKMHKIITSSGNSDNSIEIDEVLWLWGTRSAGGNTYLEKIYDDEFKNLLNQVTAAGITVVMEQCYSGGFIGDLSGANIVIATAASETELSYRVDGVNPLGIPIPGAGEDSYDEFVMHFIAALYLDYPGNTGYPNNAPAAADADSDGQVSMTEAFNYASGQDSRNETPKSSGVAMWKTYL